MFTLPYSPGELDLRWRSIDDGDTIRQMVVPLSDDEARERADRYGVNPVFGRAPYVYTCRRWDPDTRLCTRYDERPRMCSEFPYEQTCDHSPVCDHREADAVRFVWLGVRLGLPKGTWRGHPYIFGVPALTFPG